MKEESQISQAGSGAVYSEEVQDIIDRMPTGWVGYVTILTGVFISVMLALSFIIKYPDTVYGEIIITSDKAPIRLISANSGRLHILRLEGDSVSPGEIVAYIDDGAVLNDIQLLEKIINTDSLHRIDPPRSLLLGSLSSTYDAFLSAMHQVKQLQTTLTYQNMRISLREQQSILQRTYQEQERQLYLADQQLQTSTERLAKDSLLYIKGAISAKEFEQEKGNFQAQAIQMANQQIDAINTLSNLSQNHIDQAKIDISEDEELRQAENRLIVQVDALRNALRQWKEKFLLVSPIRGELEYLGFWRENEYIQYGQEVFAVLPQQGSILGEAYVSTVGFGKVKVGQTVNIKLEKFPYDEFGHIKGRVRSVSHISDKSNSGNGVPGRYLVIVDFPNKLMTNFGLELETDYEMKGSAEIITKKRRLIDRLFDNLKSKKEK